MRAYFYDNGIWTEADSLWLALGLADSMKTAGPGPFVISLAGAGGKTSVIRRLALEAVERGLKTLVITTTHMAVPGACGVLKGGREEVEEALKSHGLAVAGRPAGNGKMGFVGGELYQEAAPLADLALVEADGSRRLPLKVPGDHEPVIPPHTDMLLCLSGLSSLGRPAEDCCLRLERARALMDAYGRKGYESEGRWTIRREDMMCLMRYGYLEPLRSRFPETDVIPVFNQADTPETAEMARQILEDMGESRGAVSGGLDQDRSCGLF